MKEKLMMFSNAELAVLRKSNLTLNEYRSLQEGMNVTLELVVKARRILEAVKVGDLSALVTKTEVNLLIDEINKSMVKVFLLFKLLERKGILTEQELIDITIEFEEKAYKEATANEREPKPKTKTARKVGGRKPESKEKKRK